MAGKERTILGIDPGTNILGFGIVRVDASGRPHYVDMGVVDLRGVASAYDKLEVISEKVGALCDLHAIHTLKPCGNPGKDNPRNDPSEIRFHRDR